MLHCLLAEDAALDIIYDRLCSIGVADALIAACLRFTVPVQDSTTAMARANIAIALFLAIALVAASSIDAARVVPAGRLLLP